MSCPHCEVIERSERGEDPWTVARLATGYVWLEKTQHHPGAAFFVTRRCVVELHELPVDERAAHLLEMSEVAAAVLDAAEGATKMNYEALGNAVPHLHWWLTPRRPTDARPRGPIWEDLDFLRRTWGKDFVGDDVRIPARDALLAALERRGVPVERTFAG